MGAAKQMMLEQIEEESRPVAGRFCIVCDEPLTKEEVEYCGNLCSYHHYSVEKTLAD